MSEKQQVRVNIWLARCPRCRSSDLQHYGTRKNAKCETIRYYRCRMLDCGAKFSARVMNPDDGTPDEEFRPKRFTGRKRK